MANKAVEGGGKTCEKVFVEICVNDSSLKVVDISVINKKVDHNSEDGEYNGPESDHCKVSETVDVF